MDGQVQHLHTGWFKWTADRWAPMSVKSWPVWGWKPSHLICKSSSYLLSTGQMPDQHSWETWEEVEEGGAGLIFSKSNHKRRGWDNLPTVLHISSGKKQTWAHLTAAGIFTLNLWSVMLVIFIKWWQKNRTNRMWSSEEGLGSQSLSHGEHWWPQVWLTALSAVWHHVIHKNDDDVFQGVCGWDACDRRESNRYWLTHRIFGYTIFNKEAVCHFNHSFWIHPYN